METPRRVPVDSYRKHQAISRVYPALIIQVIDQPREHVRVDGSSLRLASASALRSSENLKVAIATELLTPKT